MELNKLYEFLLLVALELTKRSDMGKRARTAGAVVAAGAELHAESFLASFFSRAIYGARRKFGVVTGLDVIGQDTVGLVALNLVIAEFGAFSVGGDSCRASARVTTGGRAGTRRAVTAFGLSHSSGEPRRADWDVAEAPKGVSLNSGTECHNERVGNTNGNGVVNWRNWGPILQGNPEVRLTSNVDEGMKDVL